MHQGNWTCSDCGTTITELPFEPRDTSNVKCRDCHSKSRGDRPRQSDRGDRKMYQGDWKCAGCGDTISELPFEPRDTSNLKCRNCFQKTRG